MIQTTFKGAFFYLKKCLSFFDIKAKTVPPAVFICILALYALYFYVLQLDADMYNLLSSQYYAPENASASYQASIPLMVAGIAVMLLINIVSFVYLDAAVRDARREEYIGADCVRNALRCFLRLTGVTILKNMVIFAGLFMFIIPGIFFSIVLIFAECVVLDKNIRTLASLKLSNKLTVKKRGEILKIELFCNLILAVFIILLLSIFTSFSPAVFLYIILFILSICTLIELKLVAHLYADATPAPGDPPPVPADAAGDKRP